MVANSSIQPLKLVYNHNVVSRAIGLIFLNNFDYIKSKDCPTDLKIAKRSKNCFDAARRAHKLMKEEMEFDEVRMHSFLSKSQIVEKFDAL